MVSEPMTVPVVHCTAIDVDVKILVDANATKSPGTLADTKAGEIKNIPKDAARSRKAFLKLSKERCLRFLRNEIKGVLKFYLIFICLPI